MINVSTGASIFSLALKDWQVVPFGACPSENSKDQSLRQVGVDTVLSELLTDPFTLPCLS